MTTLNEGIRYQNAGKLQEACSVLIPLALQQNNVAAMMRLAQIYEDPQNYVTECYDPKKADAFYKMAAFFPDPELSQTEREYIASAQYHLSQLSLAASKPELNERAEESHRHMTHAHFYNNLAIEILPECDARADYERYLIALELLIPDTVVNKAKKYKQEFLESPDLRQDGYGWAKATASELCGVESQKPKTRNTNHFVDDGEIIEAAFKPLKSDSHAASVSESRAATNTMQR